MDRSHPLAGLPGWARRAGLLIGIFLAGGLSSFVYSYVPLHNAKNWKIAWLEERLAARDEVVNGLEQHLAALESEVSERPDEGALEALRHQLASSRQGASELEKKLAQAERRVRELERARDTWKSRLADAEAKQQELAAAETAVETPSESPAAPAFGDAASDGFDVASRPRAVATGAVVATGHGWSSRDGKAGFDLVGLDDGVARIVPDPRTTPAGAAPNVIDVAQGGRFRIGLASGRSLQVSLRGIDEVARSITFDVSE
jgi:hypothetical protein